MQISFLGAGSTIETDEALYVCSAGADCVGPRDGSRGVWKGWRGTAADFGFRDDRRRNKRCAWCRAALARRGGVKKASTRHEVTVPRDVKALRVIERWCGFKYKEWRTDEVKAWQWKHRVSLEDAWTERMRRLSERAERCAAAAKRIEARRLLGVDAA